MKYLVIETHREKPEYQQFMYFIELDRHVVGREIYYFVNQLYHFGEQIVDRVYYANERLTNW